MNFPQQHIKAVIFDLDGTLVRSPLDLKRARIELGLDKIDKPLLEAVRSLPIPEQQEAIRLLTVYEVRACKQSVPAWRARQTIDAIRCLGIKVAILTRNQRRTTRTMVRIHQLDVDAVVTRDDGPVKPHPYGIRQICRWFRINPCQAIMVGDHDLDLLTAQRAGARSVLLADPRGSAGSKALVVSELPHLVELIQQAEKTWPCVE